MWLRLSHSRFFPRTVHWRTWWIIGDGVKLSVAQVESLHFFSIERSRPAPAEDGELIARFIRCPVTIDAARYGKCRPRCAIVRDQFGNRSRAEAGRKAKCGAPESCRCRLPGLGKCRDRTQNRRNKQNLHNCAFHSVSPGRTVVTKALLASFTSLVSFSLPPALKNWSSTGFSGRSTLMIATPCLPAATYAYVLAR